MKQVGADGDLRDVLQNTLASAGTAIENYDPEKLRFDLDGAVEYVAERHAVEVIEVDWDRLTRDEPKEVRVPVSDPWGRGRSTPGQRYDFFVPTKGSASLLAYDANTHSLGPDPDAEILSGQIHFWIEGRALPADDIKSRIAQMRAEIDRRVAWANTDISAWLRELEGGVRSVATRRKERLDQAAAASDELGIPVRSAPGDRQVHVPVERKSVRVAERRSGGSPGVAPEPKIADAVYADVVRTIRAVGNSFERLPRTAAKFMEPELRDLLLFILNSNYEGGARGEVFNGSGKTDILISHEDRNAFIGECKIWTGEKNFGEAIDQLAGYAVWRDTKAALILFIRQRDASAIIAKADAVIRAHRSFVSARAAGEPEARADYLIASRDDPARRIQLALLPVVLKPPDSSD